MLFCCPVKSVSLIQVKLLMGIRRHTRVFEVHMHRNRFSEQGSKIRPKRHIAKTNTKVFLKHTH